MTSKTMPLLLLVLLIICLIISGCETNKTYTTIIRINPNGVTEEWKTCSSVTWNSDGSITFTPLKLSHTIRITGHLTVYETVVIVKTETTEEE